jgi:methionine aminotransferase
VSTARDADFANMLLEQYGIAVAPYSAFFHDKQKRNLIRINFARPNDELEKAVDILGCL